MTLRDWFWVVLVGSIWGCSFLFNAVLIRELGPIWVSAGRVGIAALACWLFFALQRKSLPRDPVLIGKLMLLGMFSYALPFTLFPLGQAHIPSGVTAIINALTPVTTVLVSQFWPGGERTTLLKSLGMLAGFSGAAILALPALQAGGGAQLWAILICLMATFVYAVALNLNRSFKAHDPTMLATLSLTGAALGAVPVAFLVEGVPVITHAETWAALLALALVSTAFTFQVMWRLLPRIGATNFAVNTFISPVAAILLGTLILHERLLPTHFLGMAAIFLGLLLIDGRLFRRLRKAPA